MPPDNPTQPATNRRSRLFKNTGLIIGLFTMVWFSIEDEGELGPMIISALISIWFGLYFRSEFSKLHRIFLLDIITGTFSALIIPLIMIILMVFKSGLHSHPTPDFTTQQLLNIFQRIPYWGLGGALIGIGTGIIETTLPE